MKPVVVVEEIDLICACDYDSVMTLRAGDVVSEAKFYQTVGCRKHLVLSTEDGCLKTRPMGLHLLYKNKTLTLQTRVAKVLPYDVVEKQTTLDVDHTVEYQTIVQKVKDWTFDM